MTTKDYLHIEATEIPLYRGNLVIILTNSRDKLLKYLPEFQHQTVYAHTWLENYKSKEGYFLVLNYDYPHRKIKHGVITHEAIHISHFLAKNRGIIADFDNDEAIAYLSEWITDTAYKFSKKHNFHPE